MLFKGASWVDIVASCGESLISLDVNRGFILSKNATICFKTYREINVSCIGKDIVLGWDTKCHYTTTSNSCHESKVCSRRILLVYASTMKPMASSTLVI